MLFCLQLGPGVGGWGQAGGQVRAQPADPSLPPPLQLSFDPFPPPSASSVNRTTREPEPSQDQSLSHLRAT